MASWFKERSIRVSDTLVSTCGLKTRDEVQTTMWNDLTVNKLTKVETCMHNKTMGCAEISRNSLI